MPDRPAWKNLVSMTGLAVVIAAGLGGTHQLTKGPITENRQRLWLETVRAVTGDDSIVWPEHLQGLPQRWHICDPRQRLRHVLQTVQSGGYAGEITLLVALTADGHLNGVRVLEHRETPGLGDAIEHEKSNWLRQLEGLTPQTALQDAARLRVDGGSIDALTGATITSRAVVTQVASKVAGFTKVHSCDV